MHGVTSASRPSSLPASRQPASYMPLLPPSFHPRALTAVAPSTRMLRPSSWLIFTRRASACDTSQRGTGRQLIQEERFPFNRRKADDQKLPHLGCRAS